MKRLELGTVNGKGDIKMFYWRLITDDDGDPCIDESNAFNTKEEAYDDMKNEALKKINRNTEYYEDFLKTKD